jgi:hypothetical protein
MQSNSLHCEYVHLQAFTLRTETFSYNKSVVFGTPDVGYTNLTLNWLSGFLPSSI